MRTLKVDTFDGVTIVVPANLDSITAYVLLEQETWFEKELIFLRRWLRPGMTAIDIGANLGIYSLMMARLVGPQGNVFAFEPASEPRGLLERSKFLNKAHNLRISSNALSDNRRSGFLVFGGSSEMNALGEGGRGERVSVSTLDHEAAVHSWAPPDFVKIDAEGEEEKILSGGRQFFVRYSPLVMFEVKAADKVNAALLTAFPAAGFQLYRQLGAAPILVAYDSSETLDPYELNLFAAKPDRARSLESEGVLVSSIPEWTPGDAERRNVIPGFANHAFASIFIRRFSGEKSVDPEYSDALAAYGAWQSLQSAAERCGALRFAYRRLKELCTRAPNAERLSTFARVAWEWGERGESVGVLKHLIDTMPALAPEPPEPFWPVAVRYEAISPGKQYRDWFAAAVAEQFERTFSFSSVFSGPSPLLAWLCEQPDTSTEMQRRMMLCMARSRRRPQVPRRLVNPAPDHLNAEVWRDGEVPGTVKAR